MSSHRHRLRAVLVRGDGSCSGCRTSSEDNFFNDDGDARNGCAPERAFESSSKIVQGFGDSSSLKVKLQKPRNVTKYPRETPLQILNPEP